MTTASTVTPESTTDHQPRSPSRVRGHKSLADRRSNVLTLAMLALLIYFLLPLFWLFVASTKDTEHLFSSFGLWFSHMSFFTNIRGTFTYDDGVYGRCLPRHARRLRVRQVPVPWQQCGIRSRPRRHHGAQHRVGDPHLPALQQD
jgi:hypothetical protein